MQFLGKLEVHVYMVFDFLDAGVVYDKINDRYIYYSLRKVRFNLVIFIYKLEDNERN